MKYKKLLVLGVAIVSVGLLSGCAEIEREVKDMESSMVGLDRKVEVYSYGGDLMKQYEGKLDVQTSIDGSTKFDLDGKRVLVKNAIVIIEEQ